MNVRSDHDPSHPMVYSSARMLQYPANVSRSSPQDADVSSRRRRALPYCGRDRQDCASVAAAVGTPHDVYILGEGADEEEPAAGLAVRIEWELRCKFETGAAIENVNDRSRSAELEQHVDRTRRVA